MLHVRTKMLSVVPTSCGTDQRNKNLKIYIQKYLILVLLLNPKISFCNSERRMIKNHHQHSGIYTRIISLITKCFAQGMATDLA